MAQIDVSDITLDPYLAGNSFTVIRRLEVTNDFGESTLTTQTLPAVGALYPTGDNSMLREEALSTQSNSITVVTQFALRGPGKDEVGKLYQPDVILWQGNHYLVRVLDQYNTFYQAECIAYDFQDENLTPE